MQTTFCSCLRMEAMAVVPRGVWVKQVLPLLQAGSTENTVLGL